MKFLKIKGHTPLQEEIFYSIVNCIFICYLWIMLTKLLVVPAWLFIARISAAILLLQVSKVPHGSLVFHEKKVRNIRHNSSLILSIAWQSSTFTLFILWRFIPIDIACGGYMFFRIPFKFNLLLRLAICFSNVIDKMH